MAILTMGDYTAILKRGIHIIWEMLITYYEHVWI